MTSTLQRSASPPAKVRPRTRALGFAVAGAAVALGVATALSPLLSVGLAAGALLVAVAVRHLPTALALWIPTVFLEAVPVFNAAGKAGGLVILSAWLLHLRRDPSSALAVLARARWVLVLLTALLAWMTLTVLWAPAVDFANISLARWYAVAALFLVVATTVHTIGALRMVLAAYVLGGVLSVLVSLQAGQGGPASGQDRLGGGAGDPNFLGAWLLSSLLLAVGLLAVSRRPESRFVTAAAAALMAGGMALTLSRGAFLAAVVLAPVALVLLRGRRLRVLGTITLLLAGTLTWLTSSERAWSRLSEAEGGSGRSDLWTLAWQMARENPLTGVGMNNFASTADTYVREIGPIETTYLIFRSSPTEAHNVYLQLMAEGGVLAVVLFVAFALVCVNATLRAARRWDAGGERGGATLAYAVLLAQISLLTAALFLSSVVDKRLWTLLALGPGLAVASRAVHRPAVRRGGEPG